MAFGAQGHRDLSKCSEIGRIAADHYRYIWVTTDNPLSSSFKCILLDGIPELSMPAPFIEIGADDDVIVTDRGQEGPTLVRG